MGRPASIANDLAGLDLVFYFLISSFHLLP